MASVRNTLLKTAIADMKTRGHIDADLKTATDTYIDTLTDNSFEEVAYSGFDQASSVNSVFSDTLRTVTYSGAGTDELITDAIDISNVRVKGVQIKGTDMNEVIQISKDGTNFSTVDASDICEYIDSTDTFKIKLLVDGANTIKGINVIYMKND
jgi:hypothetical protein